MSTGYDYGVTRNTPNMYFHGKRTLKYRLQPGEREQYEAPIVARCITRCPSLENEHDYDRYSLTNDACPDSEKVQEY